MEELIKNIILNSEENVGFIGDAEEIAEVVFELKDDGVCFYLDDEEIIEMVEDNDILQITKLVCEDCGSVEYQLERVLDEYDDTIPDMLDIFYIDSDLLDCIDVEMLDGEIVEVELQIEEDECDGDCENCPYSEDEDFEDYDEEDLGYALTEELLNSLSEVDSNDIETIVELIANKLNEAFEIGYNEALDDTRLEIDDTIEAINSLRIK